MSNSIPDGPNYPALIRCSLAHYRNSEDHGDTIGLDAERTLIRGLLSNIAIPIEDIIKGMPENSRPKNFVL